ncbi:peptidase M24, partial [Clostridium botulinum]
FTGSAGTALIGREKRILWTDGRYFIQAEQHLKNSGIELYQMRIPGWPTLHDWLMENMKSGETVRFDGRLFSANEYKDFMKIKDKRDRNIVKDKNLIEEIWKDKPELPKEKAF